MALKLFNTLTRKKELFKPLKGKTVRAYACGPTVYNFPHLGNYRAYIFDDLLHRYLLYKGYKVILIMNITDVDDKTIRDSKAAGKSLSSFTKEYEQAFLDDLKTLSILSAAKFPRATEHIKEMVGIVQRLLKKKLAYTAEDGSIYYAVSKFKGYNKLARLDMKGLKAGARVQQDEYTKDQVRDFALWKAWDEQDGDVFWETKIGRGRPGWHIECSAMSLKYLGIPFDIHAGGVDLIFPHHTNEIAQSEGAFGKTFVKVWMHNEHLLVDGKKMSKSLGNFYTLRDVLAKGYPPRAVRLALLSTHYRQKLNFTFDGLEAATQSLRRLDDFLLRLEEATGKVPNKRFPLALKRIGDAFEKAMDDDLNISSALSALFNGIRDLYKMNLTLKEAKEAKALFMKLDGVLSVLAQKKDSLPQEIKRLVQEREEARKRKDFATADKIRDQLKAQGILLEDTPAGPRWKRR